MKKTVSVLLVLLLLVSLIAGVLMVGAGAAEQDPTVIYTAGDYTEGEYLHFNDIDSALVKANENDRKWSADDILEIRFGGTLIAGGHNGILFAATTIWREDGTKLPIIIRGNGRDTAVIDFDNAGGFYACANDYTFVNCSLMIGNDGTSFFAGSGDVTFLDCALSVTTSSRVEIHDKTKQAQLISLAEDASRWVIEDNAQYGVKLIPAGDAWASVIDNPESSFYSEELGYMLRAMASTGTDYGDWTHDGDVGGGQYLNACIVFEVVTHKSCVDNTFVPDYELKYGTWKELQELAHATVVSVYGEDYFNTPFTDVGGDGKFNLLFPGSSTCYYFADELASLGYHAGLDMKVVNPYISSLTIKKQWTNYIEPAATGYAERTWIDSGSGAVLTAKGNQTLQEIVPRETWDAVFIYNGTSGFDDYYKDYAGDYLTEEEYPEYLERIQADLAHAKDTYQKLNEWCPDADLFWYSAPVGPVGAFGSTTELKGYVFADNCYDGVYMGWEEEALAEVSSSITFGDNVQYICPISRSSIHVAASGYLLGETGTALTDATAREVKFIASGMEGIPDVRPIDTHATLCINGESAALYNVAAKLGGSPCDTTVHLKKGSVNRISGDNYVDSAAEGPLEEFYGDITLRVTGGNLTTCVDATWDSNVRGDLTIYVSPDDGSITGLTRVRGAFGTDTQKGKFSGDCTTTIKNVNIGGAAHLGGGDGKVTNTLENVTLDGGFIGARLGSPTSITNDLKNVTVSGQDTGGGDVPVNGSLMGTYGTPVYGDITNTLENVTFEKNYHGGNYAGFVQGSISNTATDCTFKQYYWGGNRMSVINGSVNNTITGCFFGAGNGTTKYNAYMGTRSTNARGDTIGGQIKNIIDGATFYGAWLYCGSQYGAFTEESATTPEYRIENQICDCSVIRFSASSEAKALSGKLKNTFKGENTAATGWYGASNYATVKEAENHLQGTVSGMLCFGSNNGKVTTLKNYIEAGANQDTVYCGNNTAGTVTTTYNYIQGGTVTNFYGGSRAEAESNDSGDIINSFTGGEVTNFFGGTKQGVHTGNVKTTIDGGKASAYYGGADSGTILGDVTNIFLSGSLGTSASVSYYGAGNTGSVGRLDDTTTEDVNEYVLGNVYNYVYGEGIVTFRGAFNKGNTITGNVENFFGSATDPAKKAVLNGYVGGSYETGSYQGGTIYGAIINHNDNVQIEGSLYGGNRRGTVTKVINYFEDGFSYTANSSLYCGSNTTTGNMKENITNYFNGGTFAVGSKLYCGNTSTTFDTAVTVDYRIKNIFSGGSFGTVYEGSQNSVAGTVITELRGGTFNKAIVDSKSESTLTITPTSENELVFYIAVSADSLVGAEGKIYLGTDALINATSASGEIKIEQLEEWKLQNYVTLPAENEAKLYVTTGEGVTGTWTTTLGEKGEVVVVKGSDMVKEAAEKPSAPTLSSKTHDTVVLTEEEGYEYSLDGVTWQQCGTFEGLEPATEYQFYRRSMETATHLASAESEALSVITEEELTYMVGDLDGDLDVDSDDAVYLLFHTLFVERYPISQPVDFDNSGSVDSDDAVYLLFHTLFVDRYPLNQ